MGLVLHYNKRHTLAITSMLLALAYSNEPHNNYYEQRSNAALLSTMLSVVRTKHVFINSR